MYYKISTQIETSGAAAVTKPHPIILSQKPWFTDKQTEISLPVVTQWETRSGIWTPVVWNYSTWSLNCLCPLLLVWLNSSQPGVTLLPLAPGDIGNVWRHFWLSQPVWGGCHWHLIDIGQECSRTACSEQDSSLQQRIIWFKMSIVLRLRNPASPN